MPLSAADLEQLKARSVKYGKDFLHSQKLEDNYSLFATFLYGGAARYHFGLKHDYHDFDIEVVFRMVRPDGRQRHISTQARPKDLPYRYSDKVIQIARNIYWGNASSIEVAIMDLAKKKSA